MGKIPMVYSGDTVSFFINGRPYQVDSSMPGFEAVKSELREVEPDVDKLIALTEPIQAVRVAVEAAEAVDYLPKGTVSVTTSTIAYNGVEIHGVLVDRILAQLSEGFDIMPMVRFLENLFQNPAEYAHDELYLWLETSNLPITEDGHFLAYKRVRDDYKSIHDGRTDNTPGTIVSIPRESVDTQRAHTCSTGLHFCSASYLPHFGGNGSNKIVLLKINPADVVSIPNDYNNAKGRAWKYEVLHDVELDPAEAKWASVTDGAGGTLTAPQSAPKRDMFDPGTNLAKTLFAACNRSV